MSDLFDQILTALDEHGLREPVHFHSKARCVDDFKGSLKCPLGEDAIEGAHFACGIVIERPWPQGSALRAHTAKAVEAVVNAADHR